MAKILLVDDDEDILFLLEQSFTQAGHNILSTSDPRRVLPMVRRGRFDAVVMDVMMPDISGWSLLSQIREENETRSLPVILLTALSAVSDRVHGLRSGADDYVTKPFNPEELIVRMEGLLKRGTAPVSALQGQLEVQSVQEVLQQLNQNSKKGRLKIIDGDNSGFLVLTEGGLLEARHGELEGEDAVLSLLSKNQGRFEFFPESTVAAPSQTVCPIPPLLIRSVWIEDELAKRQRYLPNSSCPLALRGHVPSPPETLPTFPLEEILQALSTTPRSLDEVLSSLPYAPQRIRLGVAWLAEQGLLKPLQDTPPSADSGNEELGEELDMAVREVLQAALYRGISLDSVRLDLYLEGSAWGRALELLRGLPQSLLKPLPHSPQGSLHQEMHHPAGSLDLHWHPFETTAPASTLPKPPSGGTGIVLWLEGGAPEDSAAAARWAEVATHLVAQSPGVGGVLLAMDPGGNHTAKGLFGHDPRWRIPGQPPVALHQLLLELAQTDPPLPAPEA